MHRVSKSVVIFVVPLKNQSGGARLAMTAGTGLYQWSS